MISYLSTLQRACISAEDVYKYESQRQPQGERQPAVRHSTAHKAESMTAAMEAMKVDPVLGLHDCDKSLGLAKGTLSQFQKWLLGDRIPEASTELVAFFQERRDTRFVRAAQASKAAVARNKGRRNRK